MKKYIHFLFIFSLLIIISAAGFSQDYTGKPCGWGYVFSVKKDFTIGKLNIGNYYAQDNSEQPTYGISVEKFLNSKWSILGGLDVGIDGSTQEGTQGTDKTSQTELGFKVGVNNYFHGMNNIINPYAGLWANYISYSSSTTSEPKGGTSTENKYSSSTLGFGLTGGAYVKPWKDVGLSFGAGYNLGYFNTPASTITTTQNGQSTETKGPSRYRFSDCGAELMVRWDF
jgi:hypothetical protein